MCKRRRVSHFINVCMMLVAACYVFLIFKDAIAVGASSVWCDQGLEGVPFKKEVDVDCSYGPLVFTVLLDAVCAVVLCVAGGMAIRYVCVKGVKKDTSSGDSDSTSINDEQKQPLFKESTPYINASENKFADTPEQTKKKKEKRGWFKSSKKPAPVTGYDFENPPPPESKKEEEEEKKDENPQEQGEEIIDEFSPEYYNPRQQAVNPFGPHGDAPAPMLFDNPPAASNARPPNPFAAAAMAAQAPASSAPAPSAPAASSGFDFASFQAEEPQQQFRRKW